MKYQAAQRYGRAALIQALADLADADLAMKTGSEPGPLLEQVLWCLVGGMGQPAAREVVFVSAGLERPPVEDRG